MHDEISSMYWYLSVLFEQQGTLLSHIKRHAQLRAKRLKEHEKIRECKESRTWYNDMLCMAEISQAMSSLLWKFFGLLESTGIIIPPKRDFADPQLFYEARMKPFLAVSNDPVPTPDHFAIAKQSPGSIELNCKAIEGGMKRVKTSLGEVKQQTPEQVKCVGTEQQWRAEIKKLETTCVAVAVGASQLLRIHQKSGADDLGAKVECKMERKYHPWWVIPQLKERATPT